MLPRPKRAGHELFPPLIWPAPTSATSRATFERVVGHAPSGLALPSPDLKLLPRTIDKAEGFNLAEKQNPNVNSALYREEAARFAVDKVRGELLPEFNIEASYAHRENPNAAFDEQEAASISGRVSIPLYDGGKFARASAKPSTPMWRVFRRSNRRGPKRRRV